MFVVGVGGVIVATVEDKGVGMLGSRIFNMEIRYYGLVELCGILCECSLPSFVSFGLVATFMWDLLVCKILVCCSICCQNSCQK